MLRGVHEREWRVLDVMGMSAVPNVDDENAAGPREPQVPGPRRAFLVRTGCSPRRPGRRPRERDAQQEDCSEYGLSDTRSH